MRNCDCGEQVSIIVHLKGQETQICILILGFLISVTGPEFQHIRVGVGHRLDAASSGVLGMTSHLILRWCCCIQPEQNKKGPPCVHVVVLAVGNGNKALDDLYKTRVTRVMPVLCWFEEVVQLHAVVMSSMLLLFLSGLYAGMWIWDGNQRLLSHGSSCGKIHLR